MFARIDNYSMLACLMTSRIGARQPARAAEPQSRGTADAKYAGKVVARGRKSRIARKFANGGEVRFPAQPKIHASSCLPLDELERCQVAAARPKIGKTIS